MEEFSDWMKVYMIMGEKENDAAWKAGTLDFAFDAYLYNIINK